MTIAVDLGRKETKQTNKQTNKHAVAAAFRIYAERGEDAAKRGGLRLCIK